MNDCIAFRTGIVTVTLHCPLFTDERNLSPVHIEGSNRALAATADGELTAVPQYTGVPEQLWRIEQLIDGTYRIINEKVPGKEGKQFALVCIGDCSLTLGQYDFNDVNCKWNFRDR